MKLLEAYCLGSGQKAGRMNILEKFFPLPFEKYITFQPYSKDAKTYDYWTTVIEWLSPILQKAGIQIVQLGAANEKPLANCFYTAGRTNIGQVAYLIKNSLLNLSVDSFSAHLAGHYNIPLVALYSNNYTNNVAPFFGDKERQILLEPDRVKLKPSFALSESQPKQINQIKPEDIVRAVVNFLGLEWNFPYRTVFIGQNFHLPTIETVPNQVVQLENMKVDTVGIRMDLSFNESALCEQLKLNNSVIVSNLPVNLDLLKHFAPRIREFIYLVDDKHDVNFIKELQKTGIKFVMLSKMPEEEIAKLKIIYYEYGVINPIQPVIPEAIKDIDKFYYRSSKTTLSDGKIFMSHFELNNGRNIPNFTENFLSVDTNDSNISEFWRETGNFHILVDSN
jgi:hypothetical protein